ncbi:MAG: hypothetical protein R3C12_18230 [Planctomycetaceae bacterium]|nr:hypothetical protein [Planctomycetaceae bacterium]
MIPRAMREMPAKHVRQPRFPGGLASGIILVERKPLREVCLEREISPNKQEKLRVTRYNTVDDVPEGMAAIR